MAWFEPIDFYAFSRGSFRKTARNLIEIAQRKSQTASMLLSFLMSEGHPYQIPDKIIEEIDAAQKFLDHNGSALESDAVKFKKAYRDLITISQTSITYNGIPPTPFWHWKSPWLWAFIFIIVIPLVIMYFRFESLYESHSLLVMSCVCLATITLLGLYTFTGVVSNKKLNQIIIFCYVFTFFSLMISVSPFFPLASPLYSLA